MFGKLLTVFYLSFSPTTVYVQAKYFGKACEPSIQTIEVIKENHLKVSIAHPQGIECSGEQLFWNESFSVDGLTQVDFFVNEEFFSTFDSSNRVWIPLY